VRQAVAEWLDRREGKTRRKEGDERARSRSRF
jgi:hypothetical protein